MTDLDPLKPLSDEFIDRIVDGELTPAELRDAVDRLDRRARGLEALRIGVSRSPMLARVVTGYRSTNATSSRLAHVVDLAGDRAIESNAGKLAAQGNRGRDGRRVVRAGLGGPHLAAVDRSRPRLPGLARTVNSPAGTGIRNVRSR